MDDIKLVKSPRRKFTFCHRLPDRTFKIRGKYFPVCCRCTGIYMGVLVAFLFWVFLRIECNLDALLISLLFMFPMIIDVVTQSLKGRESCNSMRFITGLVGGVGYGILIVMIVVSTEGIWRMFT